MPYARQRCCFCHARVSTRSEPAGLVLSRFENIALCPRCLEDGRSHEPSHHRRRPRSNDAVDRAERGEGWAGVAEEMRVVNADALARGPRHAYDTAWTAAAARDAAEKARAVIDAKAEELARQIEVYLKGEDAAERNRQGGFCNA